MEEIVSVIIPVYNVQDFLVDCLESVINQTYNNLEIIIVNDGSTDNSYDICVNYAKIDNRITLINKPNGGLSDARNVGMKSATGKYIVFIDSDDFISINMIQSLVEACNSTKSTMGVCYFNDIDFNTHFEKSDEQYKNNCTVTTGKRLLREIYSGKNTNISFVAWAKIYLRKTWIENGILFPVGKINEDSYTTYKTMYFSSNIAIKEAELYHYRKRPGSIMHKELTIKNFDVIEGNREAIEFYQNSGEQDLFDYACNLYCQTIITLFRKVKQSNNLLLKDYFENTVLTRYNDDWVKYIKFSNLGFVKKTLYWFLNFGGQFPSFVLLTKDKIKNFLR